MSKNYLAVLVPLNEQEQWQATHGKDSREQARMSVWSTVTRFLQPYLGKEFSTFMPAVSPWGHPLRIPFGVMLGEPEAGLLLHFYALARKTQADTVGRYYKQIDAEGLTISIKAVNKARLEEMPAVKWCAGFMSGKLTADACLYFYGIGNTNVEPDVEKRIISHVNEYALCAVELNS